MGANPNRQARSDSEQHAERGSGLIPPGRSCAVAISPSEMFGTFSPRSSPAPRRPERSELPRQGPRNIPDAFLTAIAKKQAFS